MNDKINLQAKLAQFGAYFAPRTIAQLNDYDIMVVKAKGEFFWHAHPDTDDFFLVLAGRLVIRPSGTEPVIRVMGEGDDRDLVNQVVDDVVEAVRRAAA